MISFFAGRESPRARNPFALLGFSGFVRVLKTSISREMKLKVVI